MIRLLATGARYSRRSTVGPRYGLTTGIMSPNGRSVKREVGGARTWSRGERSGAPFAGLLADGERYGRRDAGWLAEASSFAIRWLALRWTARWESVGA
jgi:hypothetical protein